MATTVPKLRSETLRTLPDDNVRQILWHFADRYDLQMVVQSAREVARGPVARLVSEGSRGSHEWTSKKAELLEAFDQSGITAVFMDPEHGGYLVGPKNLALALIAFELAWVDAGAATCSLAGCLALAPIHERGTPEQRAHYMALAAPPAPGEHRHTYRGAFCLTEPIPYVGVDTGMLSGKVRVTEWSDGQEPLLHVEKRGRFITNMGFANFVTAAVDSGDDRIKGSCMVIIEESDPGVFDLTRWFYRQRIEASLTRTQRPWVLLLDPGVHAAWQGQGASGPVTPELITVPVTESMKRTSVRGMITPPADQQTIRPDAKLLFVAGAGWTKKQKDGQTHVPEAEALIVDFLHKSKASLGSSKSLVELTGKNQSALRFMSHLNQVGQTGATPRHPKGLSTCCHGEEPHTVGWRFIGERRAINLDPNCGWARDKADVLYVADAFEVMSKVNALLGS